MATGEIDGRATDAAPLAALARNEQTALAALYDRYGRLTCGLAYRILADQQVAEDVVQDVFMQAWHAAATFRCERGSVRTWLLTLARSRAIDRPRGNAGKARHLRALDDLPAPDLPREDPREAADW